MANLDKIEIELVESGKTMTLGDLIRPTKDYSSLIGNYIKQSFKDKGYYSNYYYSLRITTSFQADNPSHIIVTTKTQLPIEFRLQLNESLTDSLTNHDFEPELRFETI